MRKGIKVIAVLTLAACALYMCACNTRNDDKSDDIKPANTPEPNQDEVNATDDNTQDNKDTAKVTFDFSKGSADANHEFTDYLKDNEQNHDFKGGVQKIGDSDKKGYMLSANNQGEDLFMYVIMPVMLKSDRNYSVKGSFDLCSNVSADTVSDGQDAKASISVKAGVVGNEPNKQLDDNDYYRIDIDKGNDSSDGADIANVGSIDKETDIQDANYTAESYDFEASVVTNINGNAYIIVGVDCGSENMTTVYLENLTAEFVEM